MAASAVTSNQQQESFSGFRPINIQTDLAGIAELIEICFGSVMDESARAAIREKQMISHSGLFLKLFSGLNQLMGGLEQGVVWIEQGRLVGNVSVAPANFPRGMGRGYIIANVAVHPEYRRRGIARAMLTAALHLVRQKDGHFAILQVEASNTGARHLYESLAFREERTFVRWQRPPHLRAPQRSPDTPFITIRQGAEWRTEYELACLVRPNEWGGLGWLRPTHPDQFRSSVLKTLMGWTLGQSVERWILRRSNGQGIAASLRAQTTFGGPNRLELLVHPAYRGQAEDLLLNYALRRFEGQQRPVILEHPLDEEQANSALERYGFERRHVHVTMRHDFEG